MLNTVSETALINVNIFKSKSKFTCDQHYLGLNDRDIDFAEFFKLWNYFFSVPEFADVKVGYLDRK